MKTLNPLSLFFDSLQFKVTHETTGNHDFTIVLREDIKHKVKRFYIYYGANFLGDLTGSGPCIGDGGAGFVISQDGVHYLRGISSRTMTRNGVCTLDENFAIFCDVAKYMPWVKESMSQ